MKYKKDTNDSISKIDDNIITPSEHQIMDYEIMNRQIHNDYISELTYEDKEKDITSISMDEIEKEILNTNYINKSKYTASYIDGESHRHNNIDLEKFYEQKQNKIEQIITKRSNSVKRGSSNKMNTSTNNSKLNYSMSRQSAKTVTYTELKKNENRMKTNNIKTVNKVTNDKPKVNIKLKITNNSIEEIIEHKVKEKAKDIKEEAKEGKEANLFRKNTSSVKFSTNAPTPKANITVIQRDSIKDLQPVKPKDEKFNPVINEIKTNMNKTLSVRKISMNDEITKTTDNRKRSQSL
jgi:hypothetical protein